MKRLDIMLDLETLGVGNSPVIIQIAAVAFDMATGETFGEFNCFVSPKSCLKAGLVLDGKTVEWWLNQDDEVVEKVFLTAVSSGLNIKESLLSFNAWLLEVKKSTDAETVQVWGNGALADNKWIRSAFDAVKIEAGWSFRSDRDVRTLVELGRLILGQDLRDGIPFEGDKHDALADCKHQIKYCSAIYKALKEI